MADVTKEIALEVSLKDSTSAGTTSAKTRLRELQKTLADMALAGQDGTKAFREMEKEAGRLKDQIGDTQQRIKNLASDTRTIDTFVGAIQGITAGFQIAQGAAALFGAEEEELQKSLVKVQAAMALANGVQQVANLLNKDSILITQGQAAAQALYAVAVGTSTGAMKAFRIALLATGIGAAVAAVGLLVAKWDDLTAAVRRYLNLPDPKQRAAEQAMALQREEAQLEQYRQAYDRHTDSLIAADNKRKAQQEQRRKDEEAATRQRLLKLPFLQGFPRHERLPPRCRPSQGTGCHFPPGHAPACRGRISRPVRALRSGRPCQAGSKPGREGWRLLPPNCVSDCRRRGCKWRSGAEPGEHPHPRSHND